ncbi:type II toxin-antitoxin system VapC family toxin [Kribbella solani]|uniref:type II toxin-antitoxin system VapC family toxin n=1 Tax=Kribbella solani TaxID=236067 RepID=UPI0029BA293E|nr:type II toxin-antitoxin system VapC family toxin [Kribbella solani]MDX2972061.1 type II toxin-antitoxin system VapC family toxin [Kribbella solani]MDX3004949.1 type II toxin-antitoxin system VapC family toxin [Kribbella solani]
MIVADTNVLSEPLRKEPSEAVLGWLADHGDQLALTSVTIHELLFGILRLPDGKRRTTLSAAVDRLITSAQDRVLGYDEEAARVHAELRAERMAAGRPTSVEDGMIAAIALSHGARLATRNVAHFTGFGLEVVNPWDA